MQPAYELKLDNGLKLIVAEDHAAPVAAVSFWTRAGVCEEPEDRRGIAHFLEHMMFRGSSRYRPKEHAHRIARLGGNCNAFTSYDQTVYHEIVPAHGVEEVFRLESDRFLRLQPSAEHLGVERKVILEELRVYENQPMAKAMMELSQVIGGEHPYALTPLGRQQDLEALSVEDLAAFYEGWYRPDNVFGVVAGAVDGAQVERLAREHFGAWEASGHLERPGVPYRPRTGKLKIKVPFEVPIAARVHALPPSEKEDQAALDLLIAVLSQGRASPVREALVTEGRLCVEAGVMPLKLQRGGMLVFFGVFLPPGDHGSRRAVLRRLCGRLASEGPGTERFAQHLKQFRKRRAGDAYRPERRMLGLGSAELMAGGFRKYESELQDLERVTPDQIKARAAQLFAPENTLELDISPVKTKWWMYPLGLAMKVWPR